MAFCGRCKRVNAEKLGKVIRRRILISKVSNDILAIFGKLGKWASDRF
jgi:hypothetical protein